MTLRADWLPALAAFEAAARHQNFARAAQELHLTASAISHHVRRLERRLGLVLFQRHARGVVLTTEGRLLADASGTAFADVEAVLLGLRRDRDEHRRIRLATLHSFAHAWLIPRLPDFAAKHPTLQLRIETEIALTRFDDAGPDLGIRHGPGHWPGLSAIPLLSDALLAVASPAFPALASLRAAADLARQPLIADLARQGWLDWFRACGVHGVQPDERWVFSDSTDALRAASFGLGIALARERIVAPWLRDGRLVALPLPVIPARWSYHAVYPSHRPLRPAARSFLDWLLQEAQRPEIPQAAPPARRPRRA